MEFTIFTANCVGNIKNCYYPNKQKIKTMDDMETVIRCDHVCAEYANNHRDSKSFIASDVIPMDCDNDHSDNPDAWIMPENIADMLPDTPYVIVPSRNNMLEKKGISARPRWHIYFPISRETSSIKYTELKREVYQNFPFFDGNAIDSARFIFGCEAKDILWHNGDVTIDKVLRADPVTSTIREGTRNSTMSRFAGRVIKRYGLTDKSHRIFIEQAAKCEPPLPDAELAAIWRSACKFGAKIIGQDGYISPEEYGNDFKRTLEPDDYSDVGQAKVFVQEYKNEMVYSSATDYLRYDGTSWIESEPQAIGAVEEFLDLQLQDARDGIETSMMALKASGLTETEVKAGGKNFVLGLSKEQSKFYNDYVRATKFLAFVVKRRHMNYINATLKASQPMLEIKPTDLDADGFLLNTPQETYYLPDGLKGGRPKNAEDLITKVTSVSPGTNGAREWQEMLDLVFCGDPELIEYVKTVVGLAAIGKVYLEAMIIAYGEGSNGKSTFWNAIARVLGGYSGHISADTLMVGCKRNVKPEMAELKGKRLIIAAEPEEGMRFNTSTVKQLCSTDEIYAEKKFKAPFSYEPSHTLVLYTNHLPKVGANDDGIWRRLIVIPFNAKIDGASDIKNYTDFLVENASEAIIAWIIEGAQKAISQGFKLHPPKCVLNAINAYKEQNNWMGHFLDECCELGVGLETKSGELYQTYRAFCAANGEYTRSTADFYAAIEKMGMPRQKRRSGSFVIGMALKEKSVFE